MKRAERKRETHQRIVETAARQLREVGIAGAGLQRIMKDAGLTHGAFYSHFESKADLVAEALVSTLTRERARWARDVANLPRPARLGRFVARYLSRAHRDAPGAGCPLPSISAEIVRASAPVRRAFDSELREIIAQVESVALGKAASGRDAEEAHARAAGIVALCVGGLLLARAAGDVDLSDDILRSCRRFATGRAGGKRVSPGPWRERNA
jgi:TetR/AcrR family transcriptional repressor of nem operon